MTGDSEASAYRWRVCPSPTDIDTAAICLTLKLAEANNNLPNYREKVRSAEADAQKTSDESSNSADKATNGDVGDAKKAKRNANKAYGAAKDVISANNKVKNEEKKVAKLTGQLEDKQKKLSELMDMQMKFRGGI